jgi:hypothetical protein
MSNTRSTRSSTSNKRDITSFFSPKSKRARVEDASLEETTTTESPSSAEPSQVSITEETKEITGEEKSASDENQVETISAVVQSTTVTPLFDLGSWSELLGDEFTKSYFKTLMRYVDQEYKTATVYPPKEQMFTAFQTCDLNQLKVVIIGQDPYHGANQAHGLAFSVLEGNAPPPSLRNIFKEAKVSCRLPLPSLPPLIHLSFPV